MKTFKEVADLYASAKNPEWLALRPRSREIYLRGLHHIARFNSIAVNKITRPMVIQFRDDTYSSPGKCRVGLTVLSNVLRYAHDRGWVEYNQASDIRSLPKKKPIEPWSQDEIDKCLAAAPDKIRQAIILALYTGQRRSDLIRMRWQDYDGEYIRVRQTKTGLDMVIPVHKQLKEMLDTMPREKYSNFILTNSRGEPWHGDWLRARIGRVLNSVGIYGKSIHGLRKSAAVFLAEAGCTPHQIMAITGHQSIRQVQHYTIAADRKRLAKEAIDKWA